MKILYAVLVVLFILPGLFLLWAMWKGLRASGHLAWADSAKLPPGNRRLTRVVGFGGLVLVPLGCLLGILIRPEPNVFASEAVGGLTGGGIWFIAMMCVAIRLAPKRVGREEVSKKIGTAKPSDRSRLP